VVRPALSGGEGFREWFDRADLIEQLGLSPRPSERAELHTNLEANKDDPRYIWDKILNDTGRLAVRGIFVKSLVDPNSQSLETDEPGGSTEAPDGDAPSDPSASSWPQSLPSVPVTRPDGSVVHVEFDQAAGRQRTIDSQGNVGQWQDIEPVPDDPPDDTPTSGPDTKVSSNTIGGFPRRLVLGGGGGILAVATLGLVFVLSGGGGGGAAGRWSVTDPQNDFMPAFSDKEAIANPSAVGDVTGLDVAVADGNTTVTVTFAGSAEGLMTEGGEELAAALQFIPVGDERWIDILFDEDGSVKISDPPSGSRITATWSASNVLVFEILGVTPASGATVRFATIQRQGFSHSTDEVSLATGGEDAVVATAFVTDDSGGSGGVPDAPVIVRACDVIDVEVVSAAFGSAELIRASGDLKTSRCNYETATEIRLDLLVQRRSNPRSDAFRAFRGGYEDAGEIRSIDWGVEGELRVMEDEESSAAGLLVYVHSSDPVGREIYVRIDANDGPGQGTVLAAAIETFAKLLRAAILEAQP
jgi:hypothetical protein